MEDLINEFEKIKNEYYEVNDEKKHMEEYKVIKKYLLICSKRDLLSKKYDELETTLNKAIVMAENTGEHIRKVAKQERDLILEEAKKNASLIINDALVRSEKIEYEASLLRKNIIMFKRKLKSNLEEQLKLVDDIEVIEELE